MARLAALLVFLVLPQAARLLIAADDPPAGDWEKSYRDKLAGKISVDFTDTPLEEALSFIHGALRVNVVLDPRVPAANPPEITLKLADKPVLEILGAILKPADLEHVLLDEAIYVFPKGGYAARAGSGPLAPEQAARAATALADLGSGQFLVREQAQQALIALGPAAVPLVRRACAETQDAEVLQRARRVLDLLASGGLGESPTAGKVLHALTRKVSFDFTETPLAQAVEFINRTVLDETNPRLTLDVKNIRAESVTLKVTDMSPMCALRWFARVLGGQLTLSRRGLRISAPDK